MHEMVIDSPFRLILTILLPCKPNSLLLISSAVSAPLSLLPPLRLLQLPLLEVFVRRFFVALSQFVCSNRSSLGSIRFSRFCASTNSTNSSSNCPCARFCHDCQ